MQISEAQTRAVTHGDGPAMVLAGPGSGKTLVITERVKYLIENLQVNPRNILVITFTKAAADEMRERFIRLSGARGVTFGTFHAVFFGILKQAYHYTGDNILREEQKFQILTDLIHRMKLEAQDEKELAGELAGEISIVKNEQIHLENYYAKCCPENAFREVYRGYEKALRARGLLDFDDMLTCTYELFRLRPDILQAWQRRFSHILVDEFQDINGLQYAVVRMLAAPRDNLFIVGDDDQSIYRFRGAKPELMLNFPKDYPKARVILLDKNFRSVSSIVKGALEVIGENKKRYQKEIVCSRGSGSRIDIRCFSNQDHESLYLVKQIRQSLEKGCAPGEIAVLFRTNQGAVPFAQRLMEFNLPFVMRDALPNIFEHWIARDLFAYLHLAGKGTDRKEFLQVMNRPKRYLAREAAESARISFEELRIYYEDKEWMLDRIDKMEADLKLLKSMAPYAAVNYIRYGIGYEEYIKEYAAYRRIRPDEWIELLNEIQASAKPYGTCQEWFAHIEAYKEKQKEGRSRKNQEDAVTLATLHSSKGLEFSEVFLVDVNEGVIPHSKAFLEADLEEERRLFYVGMTRAKDRLHLFYIKERYGKAMEPSEFLDPFLEDEE